MSEWQPIETAPTDEMIWVWAPGARFGLDDIVSLCRWHEDAGFCIDELRDPVMWIRCTQYDNPPEPPK